MEKYSCWNFPYSKRYYLTHPWRWFKDFNRSIKDVCMRARYGFCWTDVWNWDHWFMHVTPQMFRHMADHGSAYPGHPPFETPERWHDWLHEMADLIETGNEEWQDEHNEYHKEYIDALMKRDWIVDHVDEQGNTHHVLPPRTELDDKYFARSAELAKQGEDNVRRAVESIAEHMYDIWD